jgi:hypothetical protein
MNDRNDLVDEMRSSWLDTDTLDRMLAGGIHPDDAPPGYSEVAGILMAVAEGSLRRALSDEGAHVALAVELVQQRSPVSPSSDRRSSRRSRKSISRGSRAKIGGLVVIGALVGSTGLAAAGVLPDAAQDAFSHVLDKVGITVPAGNDDPASSGEELSGIATTTDATGVEKGAEISSVASGGKGRVGQQGSAGTNHEGPGTPPGHAPNAGGGGAHAAGHGASDRGTSTADEVSLVGTARVRATHRSHPRFLLGRPRRPCTNELCVRPAGRGRDRG